MRGKADDTGIDLHISNVGGVHTKSEFHLYCLYYFLYGGRGIFFALVRPYLPSTLDGGTDIQIGLFVDPCFRKGLKAAWRRDTGPILPPFITANTTTNANNPSDNSDSTIFSKKSEINSSLMPMMSYQPDESINQEQQEPKVERRRRVSEMDVVAAVTQLTPDLEGGLAGTPGTGGRGSWKELDDSVL